MNFIGQLHSLRQDTLKTKAVAYIQKKLVTGVLVWGDIVSEELIAKEIGISRTPVREAFQIFTHLGIFQRIPRYGTVVREPDPQEIHDLFEMRLALESYAIEKVTQSADGKLLQRLEALCLELKTAGKTMRKDERETLTEEEVSRVLSADLNFHLEIIQALGNSMMSNYLSDTNVLLRIFASPRHKLFNMAYLAGVYGYHLKILRAIKRQDADRAKALIIEHISLSRDGAVELIKELLAEMRRDKLSHSENRLLAG
ncbi:MAG: GntR family transcriptional regulator [Chthoniobacterales bacterium]